ncbi:prolyl oligopeptidase family serine peptidase [Timonella sp. A28]|uniref:S9 family peptidase n=1 Tax=Timonella sp. A28 TaxID=3442640 RepID=UPI003EB6D4DE
MKPEHIDLITTVTPPTLSPSGESIVFGAARANFTTDSYTGQLWQTKVDGTQPPRRITRGQHDRAPQYSPDGRMIAFLRADKKGKPQIAVMDANGGEPLLVTNRHLGVTDFVWAPDSRKIAFISSVHEPTRYGSLAGVSAPAEDPRRITVNKSQANGTGWVVDRNPALFVLDVPALDAEPFYVPVGRATLVEHSDVGSYPEQERVPSTLMLSDPRYPARSPHWAHDGEKIYFTSTQHDGYDNDLCTNVYSVRLSDGIACEVEEEYDARPSPALEEVRAERSAISFSQPTLSTDGQTMYLLGQELGDTGRDFVARNTAVYCVPVASLPTSQPHKLTDSDSADYGDVHSTLIPTRDGVLAFARTRGRGELHKVTDAGHTEVLVTGNRVVTGAAATQNVTVFSFTDAQTPGDIAVLGDGNMRTVTDLSAALREHTVVVEQEEFTAVAPDGYPIHGWIYKPATEGPHPVLLNIHGGPFADYNWGYFDEAQVYAQAGYAVVQCNPRGSAGYGRAHGLAIKEAMGTLDKTDVLAFLDQALAQSPDVDSSRVGILGGSYGGYLTSWIIGHDHRFAAALVERGFLNPLSFVGTSDIGWFFADEYTGIDVDKVKAQSPMSVVHNVKTPTLVMHSENDLRCPLGQAQEYYAALRRAGVHSEMLVFPGEDHELSRSGTPWHRRQRFEAVLQWWDTHVPVEQP